MPSIKEHKAGTCDKTRCHYCGVPEPTKNYLTNTPIGYIKNSVAYKQGEFTRALRSWWRRRGLAAMRLKKAEAFLVGRPDAQSLLEKIQSGTLTEEDLNDQTDKLRSQDEVETTSEEASHQKAD